MYTVFNIILPLVTMLSALWLVSSCIKMIKCIKDERAQNKKKTKKTESKLKEKKKRIS